MDNEPIIKSYYSSDDEPKITENEIKEETIEDSIKKEELSESDSYAFKVGIVTIITAFVVVFIIISWILVNRSRNDNKVTESSSSSQNSATTSPEVLGNQINQDNSSNAISDQQTLQETTQSDTYTVQSGDTLSSIGKKLKIDYHEIINLNGTDKISALKPGQKLIIPSTVSNTNF